MGRPRHLLVAFLMIAHMWSQAGAGLALGMLRLRGGGEGGGLGGLGGGGGGGGGGGDKERVAGGGKSAGNPRNTAAVRECIEAPLDIVQRLFREAVAESKVSNKRSKQVESSSDFGVRKHFSRAMKGSWHLVPLLNTVNRPESLRPGSLVRFRCMVQNVHNPEYYIGNMVGKDPESGEEIPVCGKFRDTIPSCVEKFPDITDMEVARGMWERTNTHCIPVPGETEWAEAELRWDGQTVTPSCIDEEEDGEDGEGGAMRDKKKLQRSRRAKRGGDDEEEAEEEVEGEEAAQSREARRIVSAKRRGGEGGKGGGASGGGGGGGALASSAPSQATTSRGAKPGDDAGDRAREGLVDGGGSDGGILLRADTGGAAVGEVDGEDVGAGGEEDEEEAAGALSGDGREGGVNLTVAIRGVNMTFNSEEALLEALQMKEEADGAGEDDDEEFMGVPEIIKARRRRKAEERMRANEERAKNRLIKKGREGGDVGVDGEEDGRESRWALGQEEVWDNGKGGVMVKFYGDVREQISMNVVVEVVGILAIDAVNTVFRDPGSSAGDGPDFTNPSMVPTSVMPRLHAIMWRQLSIPLEFSWHPFTSNGFASPSPRALDTIMRARSSIASLRTTVLTLLSEALGGDMLAASYALLTLVSKVISRPDGPGLPIGKIATCISDWGHESSTDPFCQAVSELVPSFRRIPVTHEALNMDRIGCRKDYDKDTLTVGWLQVPSGCTVVFDEAAMEEGEICSAGLDGLETIRSVLSSQTLPVDFQFYRREMDVDIPSIVCCRGDSPVLDSVIDVRVPLQLSFLPSLTTDAAQRILGDADALSLCRAYLAYVRLLDWELEEDFGECCSESWVNARQRDAVRPSHKRIIHQDLFSTWISMFRFLSISYGETVSSKQRWDEIMAMEDVRLLRLDPGWSAVSSLPVEVAMKNRHSRRAMAREEVLEGLEGGEGESDE